MVHLQYKSAVLFGFLFILGLGGCSSTIDHRGKLPDPDQLKQLQVKTHTSEDVLRLIGSPTSASNFGEKKWFYIYRKTETKAFLPPNTVEEKMVVISFDDQDRVSKIIEKKPDGQVINHTSYRTPTFGHDRPILQKVFGNFGRNAKNADPKKSG